jgi:tetratricopeptide (TPR) repeat protein
MRNIFRTHGILLVLLPWVLAGCSKTDLFETAAALDQEGKSSQAVAAYQNYLDRYPGTSLAPRIYYRIARNYEAGSDSQNALKWYDKLAAEFPQADETSRAMMDAGSLCRNKMNDPARAEVYFRHALNRRREDPQAREASGYLAEAQWSAAESLFRQKKFQSAAEAAEGIYRVYPAETLSAELRSKIDALADRSKRAERLVSASADAVVLREEVPGAGEQAALNKNGEMSPNKNPGENSYESDFPQSLPMGKWIPSPDGKKLVARKRDPNGHWALALAKTPVKGREPVFQGTVKRTGGVGEPSWSPDGSGLVYRRFTGGVWKLDKLDVKNGESQNLYFTKSDSLGTHPAYHPAGNKIAFVYSGNVWLINSDGTDKTLLKTRTKFGPETALAWSFDGTLIRCVKNDKRGRAAEELLVLDALKSPIP